MPRCDDGSLSVVLRCVRRVRTVPIRPELRETHFRRVRSNQCNHMRRSGVDANVAVPAHRSRLGASNATGRPSRGRPVFRSYRGSWRPRWRREAEGGLAAVGLLAGGELVVAEAHRELALGAPLRAGIAGKCRDWAQTSPSRIALLTAAATVWTWSLP